MHVFRTAGRSRRGLGSESSWLGLGVGFRWCLEWGTVSSEGSSIFQRGFQDLSRLFPDQPSRVGRGYRCQWPCRLCRVDGYDAGEIKLESCITSASKDGAIVRWNGSRGRARRRVRKSTRRIGSRVNDTTQRSEGSFRPSADR